jgi:uncharacterized protein
MTATPLVRSGHLRPSRYNISAWDSGEVGEGALLIYNSLSGAFVRILQPTASEIHDLLRQDVVRPGQGDDLIEALVAQGILVDSGLDEKEIVTGIEAAYKARQNVLNLILMPTEKCNFRCLYCYEDFVKGHMPSSVIDGVLTLVQRELPHLDRLNIDWFGGEPLSAMGVIRQLSTEMIRMCAESGVDYSASATTNGSLLTEAVATECLALGIQRFQITLDGPARTHDQLRVLANGKGTFETIFANLLALRAREDSFKVRLRVNYTPEVLRHMPAFLDKVGGAFGNDDRYSIWFHPVGKWGGPHDSELNTCDDADSTQIEIALMDASANAGFEMKSWQQALAPFGSVCYAADPRSFVIGSDGTVYKCTVALREEANKVGHLTPDGELHLQDDRMSIWVESGAQVDQGCQACSFRPSCHGDACPLERMRQGHRACPPIKVNMSRVLPIIAIRTGSRTSTAAAE